MPRFTYCDKMKMREGLAERCPGQSSVTEKIEQICVNSQK